MATYSVSCFITFLCLLSDRRRHYRTLWQNVLSYDVSWLSYYILFLALPGVVINTSHHVGTLAITSIARVIFYIFLFVFMFWYTLYICIQHVQFKSWNLCICIYDPISAHNLLHSHLKRPSIVRYDKYLMSYFKDDDDDDDDNYNDYFIKLHMILMTWLNVLLLVEVINT